MNNNKTTQQEIRFVECDLNFPFHYWKGINNAISIS